MIQISERLRELRIDRDYFLVTSPLIWFSYGRKFPFGYLGERGLLIGVAFWTVLTLAWAIFVFGAGGLPRFSARLWGGIALGLSALGDFANFIQFGKFGYRVPLPPLLVCAAGLAAIPIFFRNNCKNSKNFLRFAVGISVAHLIACIFVFPLNPMRSDMLPLIERGLANWFSGSPAYSAELGAAYTLPYPPLTWLIHAPDFLIGIDPRWMEAVLRILLGWLSLKSARSDNERDYFALWFLSPHLFFRHDLYLDVFWLLLGVVLFCSRRARSLLYPIALGLLAVTHQWAWLLIPFLALAHAKRVEIRIFVRDAVAFTIVVGVISIYFARTEGGYFPAALFQHERLLGSADTMWSELCLGFSGILIRLLGVSSLVWIQRAIYFAIAGIAAGYFWFGRDSDEISARTITKLGLIAWVFFTFFNPLVSNYYYLAIWIAVGFLPGDKFEV